MVAGEDQRGIRVQMMPPNGSRRPNPSGANLASATRQHTSPHQARGGTSRPDASRLDASRYVVIGKKRTRRNAVLMAAFSIVVVAMFVQGCARGLAPDATEQSSTTRPEPVETVGAATGQLAVQSFLAAVEAGSAERLAPLVSDLQMALLVGVEDPTGDLMAELVTDDVPVGVARNFWAAFADSFEPFAGADLTGWRIGSDRAVIVEGVTYVFVEIEHDLGSTELVAVEGTNGWTVDLIASFGHSFAPVFNHWLDGSPANAATWGPVLAGQIASIEMSVDRTDADSIYQQDLAVLADRVSRLRP